MGDIIMWTEEQINTAADVYLANLLDDKCLSGIPEQTKYLIRNAYLSGARYILNNTQRV